MGQIYSRGTDITVVIWQSVLRGRSKGTLPALLLVAKEPVEGVGFSGGAGLGASAIDVAL